MKHRSFLKLGFAVAFLLVIASLFYVACEIQKPTPVESESPIATLAKGATYSFEAIKPELRKLLAYLKSNPQIITPAVLANAAERHITVQDLGLSKQFPSEFPLDDGNVFEVYIELYRGSFGNGVTIEDTEAYFALDIDRYPDDAELTILGDVYAFQAHVAATGHNKRKGLYRGEESRHPLSLTLTTQKVEYLLFFVGGEERLSKENEERIYREWLNSSPGLAKAQQSAATEYIWLRTIEFNGSNDASDEEFELYYASANGTGNPFDASTFFIFDGQNHIDKSGQLRRYPDINDRGTFTPQHPIAIEILTPDSPVGFKVAAIEDDCSKSAHKNDHHGGGKHNHYMFGMLIDLVSFVQGTYSFWIHDDCADEDDIYPESMIVSDGNGGERLCNGMVGEPPNWKVRYTIRQGTVADADNNWEDGDCH